MPQAIVLTMNFIVSTLFNLYLSLVILRIVLRLVHADYHHPLVQFVLKLTDKPIAGLKRIIPDLGPIELSAYLFVLAVELLKLSLLCWINHTAPHMIGLLIWALGDLANHTINVFFYAIIIHAILSWIPNPSTFYLMQLLKQITTPLMQPIRRFTPTIGMLDLSPLIGLIVLQCLLILIAAPLVHMGMTMI
jgi:YggT family protein